jgi:kanosamine 6-kinase
VAVLPSVSVGQVDASGGDGLGYLGIDIGGTKVDMRAADVPGPDGGAGAVEKWFRWPTGSDAEEDLRLLAKHVESLRRRWPGRPRGVGLAVPATCDAAGFVRAWPGRPTWTGIDLAGFLQRLFPDTAVAFADDGDLAALAEAREARCENVLYVGVGTGIGGGIVHNGSSWPGLGRGSCEVGHLVVDKGGSTCGCGRSGCVQALASGPATLRRAARLRGRDVSFAELTEAVQAEESWAVTALDESAAALATAVVSICELARVEAVVVGGGFVAGIRPISVPSASTCPC